MDTVLVVFVILLCVLVAAIVFIVARTTHKPVVLIQGGGVPYPTRYGGAQDITKDIYDALLPYLKELGSSSSDNVEQYLLVNMNLNPRDVRPDATAVKTKHPKLYQIIDDIAFYGSVTTVSDFLKLTGLNYTHFLPKPKRVYFLNNYEIKLDDELEKYFHKELAPHKNIDQLVKFMIPGNRYYKFADGYANKTPTAIKKAGVKAFTLDKLALLPIIETTNNWIKISKDQLHIIETLNKIDITKLRDFEIDLMKKILRLDNNDILHKKLKWERKALEREKLVREIVALDQAKRESNIQTEKLKEHFPAENATARGSPLRGSDPSRSLTKFQKAKIDMADILKEDEIISSYEDKKQTAHFRTGDRFVNTNTKILGTVESLRSDKHEQATAWQENKYHYTVHYDDGSHESYESQSNMKHVDIHEEPIIRNIPAKRAPELKPAVDALASEEKSKEQILEEERQKKEDAEKAIEKANADEKAKKEAAAEKAVAVAKDKEELVAEAAATPPPMIPVAKAINDPASEEYPDIPPPVQLL
jgi:hypothetical protein